MHAKTHYYVSFIDDYKHYMWIYFMHKQSKLYSIYVTFVPWYAPILEIRLDIFVLILKKNIYLTYLLSFWALEEQFIKLLILTLLNKIKL